MIPKDENAAIPQVPTTWCITQTRIDSLRISLRRGFFIFNHTEADPVDWIQNSAIASSGEAIGSNRKRGSAKQGRLSARLRQTVEQIRVGFRAVTLLRNQSKPLTIERSEQPYLACDLVHICAGSPKMRARWLRHFRPIR